MPTRSTTLSPTPRTTINRGKDRTVADRKHLLEFLSDGLVAHLGVIAGEHPVVLPTAYAIDPDGPDGGGTLYLHGSVAAGWHYSTWQGRRSATLPSRTSASRKPSSNSWSLGSCPAPT